MGGGTMILMVVSLHVSIKSEVEYVELY